MNFYTSVNASIDKEKAYENWATYRTQVTHFIEQATPQGSHLLIYGVGALLDINIEVLMHRALHITLSDIDEMSLKYCLSRVEHMTNQNELIDTHILDLLGLAGNGLEEKFLASLINNKKFEASLVLDEVESILKTHSECHIHAEVQVLLPIYSQLFFLEWHHLLNQVYSDFFMDEDWYEALRERLLNLTKEAIHKVNHRLLKGIDLGKSSEIIIFSDIIEDCKDGQFANSFTQDIQSFESALDNYRETYGYGLGDFGLVDFQVQIETHDIEYKRLNEGWFLWPFDNNRHIFVKAIHYSIRR